MKRAVFLDRDGVLAEAVVRDGRALAPLTLDEFKVVAEAGAHVARLRQAGLLCILFTNQPELARGLLAPETLEAMHRRLTAEVELDDLYVCPHTPDDGCECHKPKIGMLRAAAERWGVSLANSYVIGDRWRDIGAGQAAGCYSILVERVYSACENADARVATLAQAVDLVLEHERSKNMSFVAGYLDEVKQVAERIDQAAIQRVIDLLVDVRERGGRVFVLGVGGSAGNASHAVNDFRKIAGFEAYAPTDNVSELTARVNDDGWETSFANWLIGSRLSDRDAVCIFSVGGGDVEHGVSMNLVRAMEYARSVGARICGVVGRDGGYTAKVADACVIVPTIRPETVTVHSESFQAVIWHLFVSHPSLQVSPMKWESLER